MKFVTSKCLNLSISWVIFYRFDSISGLWYLGSLISSSRGPYETLKGLSWSIGLSSLFLCFTNRFLKLTKIIFPKFPKRKEKLSFLKRWCKVRKHFILWGLCLTFFKWFLMEKLVQFYNMLHACYIKAVLSILFTVWLKHEINLYVVIILKSLNPFILNFMNYSLYLKTYVYVYLKTNVNDFS